jgi:hypothetical protein
METLMSYDISHGSTSILVMLTRSQRHMDYRSYPAIFLVLLGVKREAEGCKSYTNVPPMCPNARTWRALSTEPHPVPTCAITLPLTRALGTGPYSLESLDMMRLSPCNHT